MRDDLGVGGIKKIKNWGSISGKQKNMGAPLREKWRSHRKGKKSLWNFARLLQIITCVYGLDSRK